MAARKKLDQAQDRTRWSARRLGPLYLAFLGLSFVAHGPAVDGGWVMDDVSVVSQNPYVQELSLENVREILDPYGPAVLSAMNYSPVHLFAHAVEIQLFGLETRPFHVVNLLLHAATALLLVQLLVSSRVPPLLAAAAGAFYVAHPANAEAAAVVFQLKTLLSTALGLAMLICFSKRPGLATILFGAALLTKIAAAFALPVALVWAWTRSSHADAAVPHWGWWLGWAALLVAVAVPELEVFRRVGQHAIPLGADGPEQLRSIVALAGRYVVMASSGFGVSAFHQPAAARFWFDPWWIAGLASLTLLAWRWIVTLRRRDEEAGYWMLAVAAFAPVSQVFPFLYPMADRYLYNVLPGLIGGALLAGIELARRSAPGLRARLGDRLPTGERAVALASAVLLVASLAFTLTTRMRSAVFVADAALQREAARNYPDGVHGSLLKARSAGRLSDARELGEALDALERQGFVNFFVVLPDAGTLIRDPRVRAPIDRMAAFWIERFGALEEPHQVEMNQLAQAHGVRGEHAAAVRALERGLEIGGPLDELIRAQLEVARREARRSARGPRR